MAVHHERTQSKGCIQFVMNECMIYRYRKESLGTNRMSLRSNYCEWEIRHFVSESPSSTMSDLKNKDVAYSIEYSYQCKRFMGVLRRNNFSNRSPSPRIEFTSERILTTTTNVDEPRCMNLLDLHTTELNHFLELGQRTLKGLKILWIHEV